jgi:N-methylhydantoinase B
MPADRPAAAVAHDVKHGYITEEQAALYGKAGGKA